MEVVAVLPGLMPRRPRAQAGAKPVKAAAELGLPVIEDKAHVRRFF